MEFGNNIGLTAEYVAEVDSSTIIGTGGTKDNKTIESDQFTFDELLN